MYITRFFMRYLNERKTAMLWATLISPITLIFSLVAQHMINKPIILFWLGSWLTALLFAFILGYKIFSKDTSKKHFIYAAVIGYLTALLVMMVVSMGTELYMTMTTNCGTLTHAQCYGTASQQLWLIGVFAFEAVFLGSWTLGPLVALLAILARHRFLKTSAATISI
jgi:hypothetical protein